jgi:hypothetical protein
MIVAVNILHHVKLKSQRMKLRNIIMIELHLVSSFDLQLYLRIGIIVYLGERRNGSCFRMLTMDNEKTVTTKYL